jgi:hypothetical protein
MTTQILEPAGKMTERMKNEAFMAKTVGYWFRKYDDPIQEQLRARSMLDNYKNIVSSTKVILLW